MFASPASQVLNQLSSGDQQNPPEPLGLPLQDLELRSPVSKYLGEGQSSGAFDVMLGSPAAQWPDAKREVMNAYRHPHRKLCQRRKSLAIDTHCYHRQN